MNWLDILKQSYIDLLNSHPRSNEKLKHPHQWIKENLKYQLGQKYDIYSLDKDESKSKEKKVNGKYYPKKVDICIQKNDTVVGVVSFKFIASNYSQNSNNYFENMIGECFNIQKANIPFCHVLVVRDNIPYFKKDNSIKRYEQLTSHNLDKYLEILKDKDSAIPQKFSLSIISIKGDKVDGDVIHPSNFKKLPENSKKQIIDSIILEYSNYETFNNKTKKEILNLEINKILKEFVNESIK